MVDLADLLSVRFDSLDQLYQGLGLLLIGKGSAENGADEDRFWAEGGFSCLFPSPEDVLCGLNNLDLLIVDSEADSLGDFLQGGDLLEESLGGRAV